MKSQQNWGLTLTATLFTAAGLLAGYIVAGGFDSEAPPDDHSADAGAEGVHLPPATLKNLGVSVGKLELQSFFRTVSVAAVVIDTPAADQPVFAPIGGRIEGVDVALGSAVEPGRTLLTLVRDPLPRPTLTLTADVLRPAQEARHDAVLELRKTAQEVNLTRTELERVQHLTATVGETEIHIIPRQRMIDLEYELARAQTNHEQATLELHKHGLSDEQIAAIEAGGHLPAFSEETWKQALARNGLWPELAEQLSQTLPPSLRALPWVTATIGELSASGLATAELIAWIDAQPRVADRFLELGVLLQRGHTLDDLKRLHALNALEPIVHIEAPPLPEGAAWDVYEVIVQAGAKVAAGDPLITLHDGRNMLLRSEPVGSEVQALLDAGEHGYEIEAYPLIRGSGPDLHGLRINHVQSSESNEGTIAFSLLTNEVQSQIERPDGSFSRTWRLREGLEYLLRVPTGKLDDVFVLPATAVTTDGASQVVFLQDGDSFRPVPVVVAYQDHEVAVIPRSKEVALVPGDSVVQSGAFELGLAMKGGDAIDPHAGHSH